MFIKDVEWNDIDVINVDDIDLFIDDFKHDEDIFIESYISPLLNKTNEKQFTLNDVITTYREVKSLIPDTNNNNSGYLENIFRMNEGDIFINRLESFNVSSTDAVLMTIALNQESGINELNLGDQFILYQDNDGNVYAFIFFHRKTDQFYYYVKNDLFFQVKEDLTTLSQPTVESDFNYLMYLVVDDELSDLERLNLSDELNQDIRNLFNNINKRYEKNLVFGVLHMIIERRKNTLLNTVEDSIISMEIRKGEDSYYIFSFSNGRDWSYFYKDGFSILTTFLRHPIEGRHRLSSDFSPNRFHPIHKRYLPHNGQDYAAPRGTHILAAGNGIIEFKGPRNGYGNTVIIDHQNGYKTLYAHMDKFNDLLSVGDYVNAGMLIGFVGKTGTATGYHLHYELHKDGVPIDPVRSDLPGVAPITGVYFELYQAYMNLLKNSNYQ